MALKELNGCKQEDIERLLLELPALPEETVELAREACDNGSTFILDPEANGMPKGTFPYHCEMTMVPAFGFSCALGSDELPRSNGVVALSGQKDLKCSVCCCDQPICPFALAACFKALKEMGVISIPLYSRAADADGLIVDFKNKWRGLLTDATASLNLLFSKYENDFSGMLIVDDDFYLDEFIDDLASVLVALGKIDEDAVKRMPMADVIRQANGNNRTFASTGERDLAARTLHVFTGLADFNKTVASAEGQNSAVNYVVNRLGHIVNDRYYLVVGNKADIARFSSLDKGISFTFEQHCMELVSTPISTIYDFYLECLDDELTAQTTDEFKNRFESYVNFNMDVLPFRGRELADYMAKHANAKNELVLPRSRYQSSSLEEMLEGIVGLEQVKKTIRELGEYASYRKTAQGCGNKLPAANMHMLFMGNPGTGKTMVARIISTMLYKIGITRRNVCVETSAKDLIGKYVGHTDKQTAEKITEALGGVLFIDEAYALVPNAQNGRDSGFGKEAIAQLVKDMEDHKDDLIVIFAGYEEEMRDFVDVNPGLSSRIGYKLYFEDYSTEELMQIFMKSVNEAGMKLAEGDETRRALTGLFDYYRRFKSFGNGRFAGEVFHRCVSKHASRMGKIEEGIPEDFDVLTLEDIPSRSDMLDAMPAGKSASEMLEGLVGLKEVKEKILELESTVTFVEHARKQGLDIPTQSLHMVFTGNSGTGKTTAARIIGEVLSNIGAVPSNRFVEKEAKDLVSDISGDTGKQVNKVVERAMGGVLFIDEAYALMESSQGHEALAVLVKQMEDHRGELVVIFAGYRHEMRNFLDANPGLSSRIGYTFHFEDYETDELLDIYKMKMDKAGLTVDDEACAAARDVLRYFHGVENFGNGRFVDRFIQETIAKHSTHYTEETLAIISKDDIPDIEHMCKISATVVYDPSDLDDEQAIRRVASHEVGHALTRLALMNKTDIVTITIEQEGNGALGYVQHKALGVPLPTAEDLFSQIVSLMGGMGAEQVCFGAYSAGNSSDLEQATRQACRYVASYGMSAAGFVQYFSPGSAQMPAIHELPSEVRVAINKVMADAFVRAQEVIKGNKETFDTMVAQLIDKQTISGDELTNIWRTCNGLPVEEGDSDE